MRSRFQTVTSEIVEERDDLVVLLGDIGVWAFRDAISRHPSRVLNFGILEQAMISFAAGLSASGFYPVVHSIAPFIVERPLEQIKVDFGYQALPGNLVSVGASFDYASLGATHHCPGDIDALLSVPGIQLFVPGHEDELESQMRTSFFNEKLSYFRLSEISNSLPIFPNDSGVQTMRKGSNASILCFGPTYQETMQAIGEEDFSVFYANEISVKIASEALQRARGSNLVVVEPFYEGSTAQVFAEAAKDSPAPVTFVGVPRAFIHSYGSMQAQLERAGLASEQLRNRLMKRFS